MDLLISILVGISVFAFVYVIIQSLTKITKNLKVIRLQIEIQNPMFISEEIMELEERVDYWQEKMFKYRNDISEKNKEIRDVTFDLFWANVERRNQFRIMIAEAKQTGNPSKIHDKYGKWLKENETKIMKLEEKAKKIDSKIKEDIDRRSLDREFGVRPDKG